MMRLAQPAVLRVVLAVIVVHVMTDALVHAGASASWLQRLLGPVVASALMVLAGGALGRLGARARAVVMLALGPAALVGGGLAAAGLLLSGPSIDGITGLAAAVAGVLLLVAALRILWRARVTSGGVVRIVARRTAWTIAGVVAILLVVAPTLAAIAVTHVPRRPVAASDLGADYELVRIETGDGLTLAGWYVPSVNGAAVLVYPGRGHTEHARMLVRHGYGVLMVDQRGQGDSDGEPNAVGWNDRLDVAAALAFLTERDDVDLGRIGGLGLSVGGEALLQAAAESPALAAVVSEGAGVRSVREAMLYRGARRLVDVPVNATFTAATLLLSGTTPPPALQDVVPRIAPRPVLFIHAGRGQGGEDLNPAYFRAAGKPKQLWFIREAAHTGGLDARPDEYERRVVGFLDAALAGSPCHPRASQTIRMERSSCRPGSSTTPRIRP